MSALANRFWSKVQIGEPDECWPWTASKGFRNYGKFKLCDTYVNAHRIAYWLDRGVYPNDIVIRHTCDNPICCNPSHLIGGTQTDNIRDKTTRNRQATTTCAHPRFYAGEIELMRLLRIVQHSRQGYTRYKFSSGMVAKMFKTYPESIRKIWESPTYLCKEGHYV